jgi:hypothetical protein
MMLHGKKNRIKKRKSQSQNPILPGKPQFIKLQKSATPNPAGSLQL